MARRLYTLLYYCITPFILLRLVFRSIKAPDYSRRIPERFGLFGPLPVNGCIWLHAVSVGETVAAEPMVLRLLEQFPATRILMTTMTPTGSRQVLERFGDRVLHVYAPYDLPGAVKRFLSQARPRLLIIMETELWPNTLHYAGKFGIPVVLANARLSARSARGYQRFGQLAAGMMTSLSAVAAQHEADGQRFLELGLAPERLTVTGSIKFDLVLNETIREQARELKARWLAQGKRFIWIAASTHEGEDELLLAAHGQLLQHRPEALLVLVPRHPERFNTVAQRVQRSGFSVQRRSDGVDPTAETSVLLGDTMGELLLLYGCADAAFVGGSLVDRGGHNMLEPAAWGIPLVTGRSDFNFQAISAALQQAGALTQVDDEQALTEWISMMAGDESARRQCGHVAESVVAANRGALDELMEVIRPFLQ